MLLIFGAARTAVLIPFVLIFGLSLGAPLVLVPMLVAESLGLKRFGSIGGIAGIFNTLGAFVGPVGAGKIYDLTGSYVARLRSIRRDVPDRRSRNVFVPLVRVRAGAATVSASSRHGIITIDERFMAAVGSTIRRPEKYRR